MEPGENTMIAGNFQPDLVSQPPRNGEADGGI